MRRIVPTLSLVGVVLIGAVDRLAAQPLLRRLEERLRSPVVPQPLPAPPPALSPTPGRVQLGIHVEDVNRRAVTQYNLAVRRGALITRLEQGSAADRAGLPIGGVIVAVDGIRVDSARELVSFVQAGRPGQSMELTYYQGPRLYRKRLQLSAASIPPGATPEPRAETVPVPSDLAARPLADPNRPLFNRLGRVLDTLVAPAGAETPPVANEIRPNLEAAELQLLREQVSALQSQVTQLTERLAELEKRLSKEE